MLRGYFRKCIIYGALAGFASIFVLLWSFLDGSGFDTIIGVLLPVVTFGRMSGLDGANDSV